MGVPGTQRRMAGVGGERRGGGGARFMAMSPLIILGLAALIMGLNIRLLGVDERVSCDPDEFVAENYAAMDWKLRQLEGKVYENSRLVRELLDGLDAKFQVSHQLSVEDLQKLAKTEASRVADRRASKPPPPFPKFARTEMLNKITDGSFQEFLDASFSKADQYGWGEYGGGRANNPLDAGWEWQQYDEFLSEPEVKANVVIDIPDEGERRRQCQEWRTTHYVLPGVDWGTLPEALRETWKAYGCDFMEPLPADADQESSEAGGEGGEVAAEE